MRVEELCFVDAGLRAVFEGLDMPNVCAARANSLRKEFNLPPETICDSEVKRLKRSMLQLVCELPPNSGEITLQFLCAKQRRLNMR